MAEKVQLPRHAVGVISPRDDVDPFVLWRSWETGGHRAPDGSGAEPDIGVAQRLEEATPLRPRKAEGGHLSVDIPACRKAGADLEETRDSGLVDSPRLGSVDLVLTDGGHEKTEDVHSAAGNDRDVGRPRDARKVRADVKRVQLTENTASVLQLLEYHVEMSIAVALQNGLIELFPGLFINGRGMSGIVFKEIQPSVEIAERPHSTGGQEGLQLHPVSLGAASVTRCRRPDSGHR